VSRAKLIYVDDDPEDIIYFNDFVDGYFNLESIRINNDSVLEDVVDEILNAPPDAIVTDFMLNEKATVGFNGQALVSMLQQRNKHLPCFLLTSHAPDALHATHDARIVQAKAAVMGGNEELTVLFRSQIQKVIADYRINLDNAEAELDALLEIPLEKMDAHQRERAVELDTYIEEHGLGSHPLPMEIKSERSIEMLTKLLHQVDDLLKKNA